MKALNEGRDENFIGSRKSLIVLGIESSCDETAICLLRAENPASMGNKSQPVVLAEPLFSQVNVHEEWGGVVPELASRDHVRWCLRLIDEALKTAQLKKTDIDLIAYTAGPGLVGALFVGACVARGLAFSLSRPFVPVHHMEAHLLVPMLDNPSLQPPFAALLVSGGHSQFYGVSKVGQYELIGETLDDAAGEAFDKVAKMLGLPYPGGPALAALANEGTPKYHLPRPMCDRPGFDLSFSGLKTATLQLVRQLNSSDNSGLTRADIAASFQAAVVDTLLIKSERVLKHLRFDTLVVAGGVSANVVLRQGFTSLAEKRNYHIHYPRLRWCTDNGVMVAYAGLQRFYAGYTSSDHGAPLGVKARWPMIELNHHSE